MIENRNLFVIYSILVSAICIIFFGAALNYLATLNLERLLIYYEGSGEGNTRQSIVMLLFLILLSTAFYFFKNDYWNKFIYFIIFIVTAMTLAFPFAGSIFNRVSYFSIPLIGLFFIRWFIFNFPKRWLIYVVLFILITGLIRIIPLITNKIASMQFLAYGHPLDPFMGILKMISSF
jgi:hypothetical protein